MLRSLLSLIPSELTFGQNLPHNLSKLGPTIISEAARLLTTAETPTRHHLLLTFAVAETDEDGCRDHPKPANGFRHETVVRKSLNIST